MKTFKEWLGEQITHYGWVKTDGQFVPTRGGETHGHTAKRELGGPFDNPFHNTDYALKQGHVRVFVSKSDRDHSDIDGVFEHGKKLNSAQKRTLVKIRREAGAVGKYRKKIEVGGAE